MPLFHESFPPPVSVHDDGSQTAQIRHDGRELSGIKAAFEAVLEPNAPQPRPLSRDELIQKIKRGESPTWRLQHNQFRPLSSRSASPRNSPSTEYPRAKTPSPLLPAAELTEAQRDTWHQADNFQAGLEIARPRSALHAGDFSSDDKAARTASRDKHPASTSPPPWSSVFPPAVAAAASARTARVGSPSQTPSLAIPHRTQRHSKRASQPSFPGFVFLPPTSPLANASTNPDLDASSLSPLSCSSETTLRSNRRHTFSPQQLQAYQTRSAERLLTPSRVPPLLRKEHTYPYQAHQPRRSISSISSLTPLSASLHPSRTTARPPSFSSDTSPLHHAPMVGSYEESILRGRMSTTPSRPLNFVAQIGVLGWGSCKASLRCPPHATVPFPAVFYSYGMTGAAENQPSPYVGLVDLQNAADLDLGATYGKASKRVSRSPSPSLRASQRHATNSSPGSADSHLRQRKAENHKRRSHSPKQLRAPPGGSYRIPPTGQLQIVIKNPHKTAVKLFLVPYDFSDMQPGTKTFLRQRSYSAGPIIDMPLSMRSNLGTDRPEASLSHSDDPRDRPVLRYLVHLNVCCLGKIGSERHYLYKSIRVVFANRVPDGKEKLRNEVQMPEPRYSAYKPSRDSLGAGPAGLVQTPRGHLSQELFGRRRSVQVPLRGGVSMDAMDGIAAGPSPSWNEHEAGAMDWAPSREGLTSTSPMQLGHAYSQQLSPPQLSPLLERFASRNQEGEFVDGADGGMLFPRSSSPSLSGEGLLSRKLKQMD